MSNHVYDCTRMRFCAHIFSKMWKKLYTFQRGEKGPGAEMANIMDVTTEYTETSGRPKYTFLPS